MSQAELAARLQSVNQRIAQAAAAAGRDAADITLVGVSKTVAAEVCQQAVDAGLTALGENYAQEFDQKTRAVHGATWHFIGPVQRNKVKLVVGRAAVIHSLDRVSLADEIARQARKLSLVQPCLVQVNIGQEPQKAGCAVPELPTLLEHARSLPSIRIDGLMCIPPDGLAPAPFFASLKSLCTKHQLPVCSMGMSADYEEAIRLGATMVRVGTAIFGQR